MVPKKKGGFIRLSDRIGYGPEPKDIEPTAAVPMNFEGRSILKSFIEE